MADAQRRRLTVGRADAGQKLGGLLGGPCLSEQLKDLEGCGDKLICVHSVTDADMKKKRSFGEKDRAACNTGTFLESEKANKDPPPIPGVKYTCKKGLKPESPNQDSFVVVSLPTKWSLYGVFDGHGPNGHDVSDFAVKSLVNKFFSHESFTSDPGAAFSIAFTHAQKEIEEAKKNGLDASSSGSTCTMAFHNLETDDLTIAHVGDSRGVLYCGAVSQGEVAHETEDHKPNLPGEKARIEKMGGRVVFDGYYNYRVFAAKGMYPGLNMSRAFGDIVAHKEAGLTAEPETITLKLKEERAKRPTPLTLFLCSDGVWEFIKSEEAISHMGQAAGTSIGPDHLDGVGKLAQKSWDLWMEDSDNEISDDITVIAVLL